MYPNMKALEELARLNKISLNNNPTCWETEDRGSLKISSLNCRSLKKHHKDIISDKQLLKSDIIGLQEIWIEDDNEIEDMEIEGYELQMNSNGRGKGVATYFKKHLFKPDMNIKEANMQLSKFTSTILDVIVLYRSQPANFKQLNENIALMTNNDKPLLVIGDFNFCFLHKSSNSTKSYFKEEHFTQLIREPTHIDGHLLDQAYLRDINGELRCTVESHSKYYTDHMGLAIIVKKGM